MPAWRTNWANTRAAVGEGQILPVQTNRTCRKYFPGSFGSERHSKRPLLQLGELVAGFRRLFELEVTCVLEHLLLKRLDLARDLFLAHDFVSRAGLCGGISGARVVGVVYAVDQVLDALHHPDRRDAVVLVVSHLLQTPAACFCGRSSVPSWHPFSLKDG